MTVWQAIEHDSDNVVYQADSAKELAVLLSVSPKAIYMAWYRRRRCFVKRSGRNKRILIEKVVIEDD